MPLPITHVATTDITDMMAPGDERRMDLPGFAAEFVDFPHYIIRITERIWHDKAVDKILDWYADDCPIHTLAGDIVGARTVVDNTHATLAAFPDRRLDGDNVIWSDEGDGAFYSSHLITSKMTNRGDSEFGPATGKRVRVQTIADCLCAGNKVVEEWLVRDNLALAEQLGFDPDTIAARQAKADKANGQGLIETHADARAHTIERHKSAATDQMASSEAVSVAITALQSFWTETGPRPGDTFDFRANASMPGGVSLYGPDDIERWMAPLRAALSNIHLSVDHVAEIPYLGAARDVALRWSIAADHSGDGRYGAPTGAPLYLMGVSHYRVMNGRVREDVTIWDDLAMRRQVETARL